MHVPLLVSLLVAATASLIGACAGGAVTNGPLGPTTPIVPIPIGFETIEVGDQSGIVLEQPQVFTLDTEDQWADFWSRHHTIVTPQPALPAVDFSRDMVIAVVDRTEPSGGFRLEITDIEDAAGRLVVRVSKTIPGPDCIVTAVITQPFHLVRMAKSDLEPDLLISEETVSCG